MQKERFVFSVVGSFFILFFLLALFSDGTYEHGDSIQHYLISKYAFTHPRLFFHHWGKPFFTLLSSPFSQFGFIGICFFNILSAVITAYIVYCICDLLKMQQSHFSVFFVLFTPIYTVTLISGLTEPMFSLMLSLSILMCLKNRFSFAAILISFLPFVRSEGFLFIPFFVLFFALKKKNWPSLLLLTGSLVYSIVGYFNYYDLFWIIHQNPYKGAKELYGSGSLFHFISKNEFILGVPIVVFFLLGILYYVVGMAKKKKVAYEELLLIVGIFFIYLAAHSFFWWKGIFGSLGLIRVMAAVAPLSAIISFRGFLFLLGFIKNEKLKKGVAVVVVLLVIIIPFKQHEFPRPLDDQGAVVKETTRWIKENTSINTKIYYQHPYVPFFLNIDPFDNSRLEQLWYLNLDRPESKQKAIVVWDSHFSPQEGRTKIERLINCKNYTMIKKVASTLNSKKETPFEIIIFEEK